MANHPVVVVIDDSPTIRKIMELTLQRVGLRVVGVASGVAGLAAVAEHSPALIFLDIVLPNVNGYQLCQVIKNLQNFFLSRVSAVSNTCAASSESPVFFSRSLSQ